MAITFKGGVRIKPAKAPFLSGIAPLPPPEQLILPLLQHKGAPAKPLVLVGDHVRVGQKIADSEAAISAPVHAPVSGRVLAIEERPHPAASACIAIVLENDFQTAPCPGLEPAGNLESLSPEQIVHLAREAGIVGLGGAGFPLHAKLQGAIGRVKTLLINGCECEPLISSDRRMMTERPGDVVGGARLIGQALGHPRIVIGVEDNKPDAIEALQKEVGGAADVEVLPLRTKYPQGGERVMVKAVCGDELPLGKLPADCGYLIVNVSTAAALFEAATTGRPLTSRYITVAGSMLEAARVVEAPIGTPIAHLLAHCGPLREAPRKIVLGGPMMGVAQHTLDTPIIKTSSALLLYTEREAEALRGTSCIHCGKCMQGCPMRLSPCYLNIYADSRDYAMLEKFDLGNCIECGVCSYNCPARLPLLQKFRLMKAELAANKRALAEKREGAGR
ncbi:MAG: electron transport complex subunit RsxC [Clostridiales bacterium]|nr:electron transport complex subunit RsxC [Clostridiales bacterium]